MAVSVAADITAMTAEDVPSAHALLTTYLNQFKLAPQMTEEEFAHWLLPREGVVDCFVVKDDNGKVKEEEAKDLLSGVGGYYSNPNIQIQIQIVTI